MKNYAILLLFLGFLSCRKESTNTTSETKPASELIAQQWRKITFQVLENGYDNSVKVDPFSAVWTFKKGGEFAFKECADCSTNINANWTLSADNKKITVAISPNRRIEYSIVSLSSDKLIVQALDFIGPIGVACTTGEPDWTPPSPTKGLVQYEFESVK